jgi:hypothetical protein
MQFIRRLLGQPDTPASARRDPSQFHESDATTEQDSRTAPRRELVQVVLRDTMRRHGIPSAWIDCRILSVVTTRAIPGMHVQFVVRDGEDRLLGYVPAFQGSFMEEIVRYDARVHDWLLSISWQFEGLMGGAQQAMPDPASWTRGAVPVEPPSAAAGTLPAAQPADDDVMQDLQALFAIRDAAMLAPGTGADFAPTQPEADPHTPAPAAGPKPPKPAQR